MNKLILSLLLALLAISCQNTPKNAAETTGAEAQTAATAPPPPSAESLQQASANLETGVKVMEDLRKQVDALPANVRKQKAAEIENYYAALEGMIEKQATMLNEVKAVSGGSAPKGATQETDTPNPSLDAATVKDFNESAARYAKEAQAIQEALQQWTAPAKKNQ